MSVCVHVVALHVKSGGHVCTEPAQQWAHTLVQQAHTHVCAFVCLYVCVGKEGCEMLHLCVIQY